jgi:hypothetical protein
MAEEVLGSDAGSYFHSLNCDIFWLDKPGDTTVRPIPPERLEWAKALRARILAAEGAETQTLPQDQSSEGAKNE